MTRKHPHPGSRGYPETVSHTFRVEIVDDDVITVARVYNEDGGAIAAGVAKRHRTDKRNSDLGRALALSRAYESLATEYSKIVAKLALPDPTVAAEEAAMKTARRASRAESKARKDERRKAAREAYEAKSSGWGQRVFDGRDGVA